MDEPSTGFRVDSEDMGTNSVAAATTGVAGVFDALSDDDADDDDNGRGGDDGGGSDDAMFAYTSGYDAGSVSDDDWDARAIAQLDAVAE